MNTEDVKVPDMRSYFVALFEACGLEPKTCGNPWYALEEAYSNPPRAYHNINHAIECALMGESLKIPDIGVMALLYHDAHYVPGSSVNEEESIVILNEHFSDWRANFAPEKNVPLPHPEGPSPLEQIATLIRATKHDKNPTTPLEAMVMDIDMAILGSEPKKFELYDRAIREEYSFASDFDYEQGRIGFLRSLLAKPYIYYSALMRARFEKVSRENIRARIERFHLDAMALKMHVEPVSSKEGK